MFSEFPVRQRVMARVVLSLAWLLTAAGGLGANFAAPATIESELGTVLTLGWSNLAATSAVVAFFGVALDRYRLEWVAAWFTASALVIYGLTVWWLFSSGETGRWTQACLITAFLLAHPILRAVMCSAHAAKLRSVHSSTGSIDVVSD